MHDDQTHSHHQCCGFVECIGNFKKKIEKVRFVVNGAGAAAVACIQLYESLGAKRSNVMVLIAREFYIKGGRNG